MSRGPRWISLSDGAGSSELVSSIKDNTKIPVLGHAEGICHMFIDAFADIDKAIRLVLDAKLDYPAACNSIETLLLHEQLVASGVAAKIVAELKKVRTRFRSWPRRTAWMAD